jgi:hypothetical protein
MEFTFFGRCFLSIMSFKEVVTAVVCRLRFFLLPSFRRIPGSGG